MINKPLLVWLGICAMLVADSEAWRRSKLRYKLYRPKGSRRAIVKVAAAIGGKRDADCGPGLTSEETNDVVQQLEQSCPDLGLDPSLGLDRAYLEATFAKSDANDDGALTGEELDEFVLVIEALHECKDYERQKTE